MTHLIDAIARISARNRSVYQVMQLGLLMGSLSLCGCNRLAQSDVGRLILQGTGQAESVEAIHDQAVAVDRAVYLTGTVGDRIPLLDGQLYQLQDQTGSIWVVTSDQTLQEGDRLVIRGAVRFQDFPEIESAPGEFYIQELQQIEKTTASDAQDAESETSEAGAVS